MRVAMVAYAFYDGNSRIQQYARALAMRGDTVDVIVLRRDGYSAFETIDGVNVYRIQDRKLNAEGLFRYAWQVLLFMLRSSILLTRMHLKDRYDVVHVHSVPDFLVFAALVPKLSGASIVLDIHDILPEFYSTKFSGGEQSIPYKLLILVERVSIAFSNHVIIANPIWNERLISRSIAAEKVTTIENYPDPEIFFTRHKDRHDGKFIMIYPGSLNWHQGVDIAVHAFAKIAKEIPEAEFHIYGEGPERVNLERLARELKVEDRVNFSNFLPTKKIVQIMAASDVAVVPKRAKSVFGTEAASTKIMEFMSLGVPLIVSKTRIDSFYHTDATVKFYDSDDPEELAKAILFFYRNPALRRQLAANASAYACTHSWKRKQEQYFAIVNTTAFRDSTSATSKPKEQVVKSIH